LFPAAFFWGIAMPQNYLRHCSQCVLGASALAVSLASAGTLAHAQPRFDKSTLPAPASIELKLAEGQKATKLQIERYQVKLDKLRTHHLPRRTLIAPVPFSNTISQNQQPVKPRNEARFGDGLVVEDTKPVSTLAKMDYNYVSPVAEPSSAISGKNILVTFNWGAVWSDDGGKKFYQLDPYALFDNPTPPLGNGFCCDQLALYIKSHNMMVWLLQGSDKGGNTVRLLFAKDEDIAARQWRVHDFTPVSIGGWADEWFDYPDMAVSDRHLFITFNSFRSGGGFKRSVVMRFPLDELRAYGPVNVASFSDRSDFSPRLVQGAKDKMFWAVHEDTATLKVRTWSDADEHPQAFKPVPVEPYVIPDEQSVKGTEGPNGRPWLNRLDDRITAGWVTEDTIGFAWASGRITPAPGRAAYPHPHVRVAIVDKVQLATSSSDEVLPVDQPHIWNSIAAMVYPTAAPNAEGIVGLSLYFGGKKHYPSAAIGVLRKQGSNWTATLTVLATGETSPRCLKSSGVDENCGAWGDYINVRPQPGDAKGWYVATHSPGGKKDVTPKVVITLGWYKLKGSPPLADGPQSPTHRVEVQRSLTPSKF
jgi:hypothetical protein